MHKIIITGLLLYEFVIITLLRIPTYCYTVFNVNFCSMGTFKYFMLCIMVPVSLWLIVWWMPTISQIFYPNKCECENKAESNTISKDIQRLIMAAIAFGIKKILEHHQKSTKHQS